MDNPTAPSCIPPLIWKPVGGCQCLDGSAPAWNPLGPVCAEIRESRCTVTIQFSDPNDVQITNTPACDAAGIELALAVALAKLLGAK